MHLKNKIQELRDGFGSISRRGFDIRFVHYPRSRSMSKVLDRQQAGGRVMIGEQGRWAYMPPELLRDVLRRVESEESTWPSRRDLVACACVCRNWRNIIKELVKPPEHSGKLTFPISLKQPGPRNTAVQCFIKRTRSNLTYHLYLGLGTSLVESEKFLLAARKVRHATSTDYIISLSGDDLSKGSNTHIGKLRSNFLGTKFTIYDNLPPHSGAVPDVTGKMGRRVGSKQVCPRVPSGNYSVANITYELNVLGTRGPRKMHCTMHSIPASAMEPGGVAPTPVEFPSSVLDYSLASLPYFGSKSSISECMSIDLEALRCGLSKEPPLTLKNKAPRWHEQLQCWCLNFRGRVTVASVKNFQLVVANESLEQPSVQNDHDKVLLQFGKVGKDTFTMDYRYPLSAFQAFAICLSSFDTKLACE